MIGLLRYQSAILLRSHRWIFPLIAYGLLIAVGAAGSTSLAETLDWSGAMLVPVVAFLTRGMLTAEPDAARACVSAAASPIRAQLATLIVPLGGGAVLGVAATVFDVLTAEAAARAPESGLAAKVTAAADHPGIVRGRPADRLRMPARRLGRRRAVQPAAAAPPGRGHAEHPRGRHPRAGGRHLPRQRGHQPHHGPGRQPPGGELAGTGPAGRRGLPAGADLGRVRDRGDAPRHLVGQLLIG